MPLRITEGVPKLREALAGFTQEEILDALGLDTLAILPEDLPLLRRRVADPAPLHTLLKLFRLGSPVGREEAAEALPLDDALAMGVVRESPDGIRSDFGVDVFEGMHLFRDRAERAADVRPDHVMGVSRSTELVAGVTVRLPADRAVDLGTGCGALALLVARRCKEVVATDINPRALRIAAFNARLNGISNVRFVHAEFEGGVAGGAFDLAVCNPPFVVSPESGQVYRDATAALGETLARVLPAALREGGYASFMCNWGMGAGEDWWAAPGRWLGLDGYDALLLGLGVDDPLTYASTWNRGVDDFADALDRWVDYYSQKGIRAIGKGAIVIRKRARGPNWLRPRDVPPGPVAAASEQVLRLFAAEDALAGCATDEDVLDLVVRPSHDHALQQSLQWRDGRYVVSDARVGLVTGLRFRTQLTPEGVRMLTMCDGVRPVGAFAEEIVRGSGKARDEATRAIAGALRRLVGLGILEVVR